MDFTIAFRDILSITLILFAIIDIVGALPVIINLRGKFDEIEAGKATLAAGVLMIGFLFLGQEILALIGIDLGSFATAGAIVIFIIAMEMILGIDIFKSEPGSGSSSSIVPIAFPLIAGSGTLTTLLSLRASYGILNIIIAILINLLIVYVVLKSVPYLERKLGKGGMDILRKAFGVVLLAIAVKLFKTHSGLFPG